jgi:hypothetical protein
MLTVSENVIEADLSCKHNSSLACDISNHHGSFAENSSLRGRLRWVDFSRVTDISTYRT